MSSRIGLTAQWTILQIFFSFAKLERWMHDYVSYAEDPPPPSRSSSLPASSKILHSSCSGIFLQFEDLLKVLYGIWICSVVVVVEYHAVMKESTGSTSTIMLMETFQPHDAVIKKDVSPLILWCWCCGFSASSSAWSIFRRKCQIQSTGNTCRVTHIIIITNKEVS